MDIHSLKYYLDCRVKLILKNNFWYVGKVIEVKENQFILIDKNGDRVSLDPSFIQMIEEVKGK